MRKIHVASITSVLLISAAISFFILDSSREKEMECQRIQTKIEILRSLESGGSCTVANDCKVFGQSCSSLPTAKVEAVNVEFERLSTEADVLNCDVGFMICEFAVASCKENVCVTERASMRNFKGTAQ